LAATSAAFAGGGLGCDKGSTPNNSRPAAAIVDDLPPVGAKAVFYKFGPAESKITFTGAKITQKHDGAFKSFEGTIGLVNNDPHMSAVQVSIDMDSLTSQPDKLTGHLKSPDFFDVAKFPKATFASTTIRPAGTPSAFNVTGKLDLHGVSKPLTFPATIRLTPESIEANGEIKLNRKDFGIVYPGMPDDLISDDVTIQLTIHAVRAKTEAPRKEGPSADAKSD
jgi:polyisoprenoid-binding protein YceI